MENYFPIFMENYLPVTGGRYTAIKQALRDLDYYKDMYIRKSSWSVYNDVVSKLKTCLSDSEN